MNAEKTFCPFKEKCCRKNPIHLSEMSHPHLEALLTNQLDGMIKIPEVFNFTCDDCSQLLDQLKVLQMVLRKEREKNGDNSLSVTSIQLSKAQSSLSSKEDLEENIVRHKEAVIQKRQDKLKQMDIETQALSKVLNNEEHENSDDTKTRKRSPSPTVAGAVMKKIKEIKIEDSNDIKKSQQITADSQSSSISREQSKISSKGTSIMDIYRACESEKSKEEVQEEAIRRMRQSGYNVVEPGKFAIKYALSAPYHLFFTRVEKSEETYNQQFSITFPEILDRSLGEIVNSLHLNDTVDIGWLCLQYLLAAQRPDMMILYNKRIDTEDVSGNIIMIDVPVWFGRHHTKMMILQYNDGIRVIVSTVNLYSDDWENRTQGLWISPHLPPLPKSANSTDGNSQTNFKKDLLQYLSKYKNSTLEQWMKVVEKTDFSAVNVFLLACIPGSYRKDALKFWGYKKLAQILSQHVKLPRNALQWPIIAQSSSVGNYGCDYDCGCGSDNCWLSYELIPSMSRCMTHRFKSLPKFQFIYPSVDNYEQSFDFQNSTCCSFYTREMHSRQPWLNSYLYQWKATRTGRDKAMPHMKSYTRVAPDLKSIPWFVLTSANLSKAGWGIERRHLYCVANYEAGVVFLPKFITGTTTFPISEDKMDPAIPIFPIPYDLPLCQYNSSDSPLFWNIADGLMEELRINQKQILPLDHWLCFKLY